MDRGRREIRLTGIVPLRLHLGRVGLLRCLLGGALPFHSVPLLDQAALIACLAYIDLNPIRAKVADRPDASKHTSGYRRIRARNRHRAAEKIKRREPKRAAALLAKAGLSKHAAHPEDGLWLTPLARCQVGEPLANKTFTVDEYLTLLDATGRLLKAGKRGAI